MQLETLESRRMMSVSLNNATGVLTANGTPENDVIAMKVMAGKLKVSVQSGAAPTQFFSFLSSQVKQIMANGGSGKDRILLDDSVKIPSVLNAGYKKGTEEEIRGGGGQDIILVHTYLQRVHGGAGNDVIYVNSGLAEIWGDAGDDIYVDQSSFPQTSFDGGDGSDTADFAAHKKGLLLKNAAYDQDYSGHYTQGANGPIVDNDDAYVLTGVENFTGGSGDDIIYGNAEHNVLRGNGGNDTLYGGAGNDRLNGGGGSDRLFGDDSSDILYASDLVKDVLSGGAGSDFAFSDKPLDRATGIESFGL